MRKGIKLRLISSVLITILAISPCLSTMTAYASTQSTSSVSSKQSGVSYAGEQNAMTTEQYNDLGLVLNSPSEFDENDTSHPLEMYEPVRISELYVGDMNRTSKYKGSFRVMNDTSEISGSAFNFDRMDDNLVGSSVSFNDFYEADNDPIEVQTNNTCAIDYDGDGTDEILNMTLYVDRDADKCSFLDVRVFDLENGSWVDGAKKTYRLSKKSNDCKDFVWDITADTSKSYTAMTAGDYDGDGQEEGAIYVASKENGDAYIAILEIGSDKTITQKDTINVSELNNGSSNKFNMSYNDWYLPVVSLSTTKISGQDDLVINISNPRNGDSDNIGHTSAMGIYHCNSSGQMVARYTDKNMVYGSNRIRFASATDADINGNGVQELIIGGNLNNDWDNNKDAGSISTSKNYIQAITWNNNTSSYEKVWDTPQTVEAHSTLKVSEAMNEPVALAAGKVKSTSDKDMVFLEGILLGFSGETESDASEKECLQNGSFYKELKIGLGGSNSAFISTAQAGMFSVANGLAEQIVILAGDHRSTNNDNMYYDVIWLWEKDGKIQSEVTNNDYFDLRNEDDDGTFMSICAMDVDQDSVYVEYVGKEYGWTSPELFTVLQSAPYWEELDYADGPGTMTYSVDYGDADGIDSDWGVQLGASANMTMMAGAGVGNNKILNGMAVGLSFMAGYIGNRSTELAKTDTWERTMPAGKDYAVLFAIPVVDYKYKLWIPATEVTAEYRENYQNIYGEECPYQEGEMIGNEMQDCSITTKLDATFSAVTLDEYNAFVANNPGYGLERIDKEDLESKTIGDPTTYPKSTGEILGQVDEKTDSMHLGKYSANISAGDGSTSLSYSLEDTTTMGHGFHCDLDFSIGWAGEAEVSFFAKGKTAWTLEGAFSAGGGATWVHTDAQGMGFTSTYTDLPAGTDESYNYNVNHAIYQLNVPTKNDEFENPYILSHVVTGTDEGTAPPKVAKNIHVFGTTDSAVLLRWNDYDYRGAESYVVYTKDNLGNTQCLGTTDKKYYLATGLDPATEYNFAVQSITGDRESVLSRWVSAMTKDISETMPYFVTQPVGTYYSLAEIPTSITLNAEAETDVAGAKISYQWQQLVEDSAAGISQWENISGATKAAYDVSPVPTEAGQTYYRVVATQKKDSSYKSIVSKTATIIVTEKHVDVKPMESEAELTMEAVKSSDGKDGQNASLYVDGAYYVSTDAESAEFEIRLKNKDDNFAAITSGTVRLYYLTDDGQEITLGIGECSNEKAVIKVDDIDLEEGTYQIYAAYMGGTNLVENTDETVTLNVFLPADSEAITVHVEGLYDITYELNGGMNSANNPTLLSSASGVVQLDKATKQGYSFEGWYWDEACTEKVEENQIIPADLAGDVTLYANYTANLYAITYELDGGINAVDNPSSYTVEDQPLKLSAATKEGYAFIGWYKDADLTQLCNSIFEGTTGDLTLYAGWKLLATAERPSDDETQNGGDDTNSDGPIEEDEPSHEPSDEPSDEADSTIEGAPEDKNNQSSDEQMPSTGDEANVMMWMLIAGIAAAAVIYVRRRAM